MSETSAADGPGPSVTHRRSRGHAEGEQRPAQGAAHDEPATVLEGSVVAAPLPQRRGRRSVSLMPALIDPVPVAEDAPGRIDYVVTDTHIDDHVAPAPEAEPHQESASDSGEPASWLPVAVVAIILVVVFVVGVVVTR